MIRRTLANVVDYFANKRWLVVSAGAGTALGIAVEIAEKMTETAIEVRDVGVWQALPVVFILLGQLRANSNRYVDEVTASAAAAADAALRPELEEAQRVVRRASDLGGV